MSENGFRNKNAQIIYSHKERAYYLSMDDFLSSKEAQANVGEFSSSAGTNYMGSHGLILIIFIVNIFVAKMSSATTGDDLATLFGEFGTVSSAKVIMDKETGNSKCFGFVEMEDETEGMNAINALNESEFQGRKIVVKKARPREEGENRGHRSFSPRGGERRFNPNH